MIENFPIRKKLPYASQKVFLPYGIFVFDGYIFIKLLIAEMLRQQIVFAIIDAT